MWMWLWAPQTCADSPRALCCIVSLRLSLVYCSLYTTWFTIHHVSSARMKHLTHVFGANPHPIICCSAVLHRFHPALLLHAAHKLTEQTNGQSHGERRQQHTMQATYILGDNPCNVFSVVYSLWWKHLLRSQAQSSWEDETHRVQIWPLRSGIRVSQTSNVQADLWWSARDV